MRVFPAIAAGLAGLMLATSASAAGGAEHASPPEEGWPFEGPLGNFEMDSVQRGYQVYQEVCSSCHGMKLMSYRNLGEKGGPFYDPAYPNANDNPTVKAFAAEVEILGPTPDENGDLNYRPAKPSDTFREPYANVQAAAASNNGAAPPDLSVITKARHGGASYVYRLLTGYPETEEFRVETETVENTTPVEGEGDTTTTTLTYLDFPRSTHDGHGDDHAPHGELYQAAGQYYNPYMAGDTSSNWEGDPRHPPKGGFLAMPPQLTPDKVEYLDGTEATVDQMAYDVAQFLAWAGEPKQGNRKSLGLAVIAYLLIFAILLWFSYKQIWRNVDH